MDTKEQEAYRVNADALIKARTEQLRTAATRLHEARIHLESLNARLQSRGLADESKAVEDIIRICAGEKEPTP